MTQAMLQSIDTLLIARWSVDDYHRMIASGILDERRVELLDGVIVEMKPPEPIHEEMGDTAAEHLRERLGYQVRVREGKAITLSPASEPILDIAVVERHSYAERHPYPENIYWLIEIANSRSARDTEVKTIEIQAFPEITLSLKSMKTLAYGP